MLEVTKLAVENVKDYMRQEKIDLAIRVTLMSGGCAEPSLGLGVDKGRDNDHSFDRDGVSLVVDKGLVETCGSIKVDFIEKKDDGCCHGGFAVTSEKPLSRGVCGCSCTPGSCS